MKKMIMMMSAALLLALTACTNEPGIKTATGEYSYRLSGSARIYDSETDDAVHVTLTPETGTVTVIKSKEEANKGIAQVFADDGSTYEMPLVFSHDTVHVDPLYRDIVVKINGKDELFHVVISGEGVVLDKALSIHLGYSGRCRDTSKALNLTAGDVHMNCKKL